MRSRVLGRRAAMFAGLASIGVLAAPVTAWAATGTLHLETFNASGGPAQGFDIDQARKVSVTASSVDFRLGTNSTSGYRELRALNGAGVANLGTEADFDSLTCPQLRAFTYSSIVATGPSAGAEPVVGTVYAARSRIDGYVKLRLTTVDLTSPNGLIWDFVTFACRGDSTPPVIVASVSGPAGNAGWYVGAVNVSWSVTDAESSISSSSGCGAVTLTEDTAETTLTCTATSDGGTSSQSVTVAIDATPPVVAYSGNAATYTVDQQVQITCRASDALSGLASDTCASVDAPAYTFHAGENTLSATATDVAGNDGSGSTTFTVVVDAAGMNALIDRFVSSEGVANSLKQKLENAENAPNENARRGMLNAFRNELRAQTPESISEEDAAILRELSFEL